MNLNTLLANDNPHFTVFGVAIYYYAVIIVCGMILGIGVACLLFKRRNLPVDWVLDLVICVLPLAIIGARVFYCITDQVPISEWISGIRDGGLSIIGGVIGGAVGVAIFCILHKVNFLRIADCVVPALILGQGIGRWGNFVNQEVYGGVVTNEALQWFPFAVFIDKVQEWHYAFFFYESMLNLIVFALLFTFMWKFFKKPNGLALCGYLFAYGTTRSVMEPLRDGEFILGSNIPVSQVMAIIMAVGGVVLAIGLLIWNYKKHGKFVGAASGEPLAIMPRLYTKEQLKKMKQEEEAKKISEQKTEEPKPTAPPADDDPEK